MPEDLISLATRHGTDKWGGHFYARHYDRHFAPFRDRPIRLLEIGIGGYDDPQAGGQSLRMWRDYFPLGMIYGIDIADKAYHDEERIKTFVGSQSDPVALQKVVDACGGFDIVVDDGSHRSTDVLASFDFLFPHVLDGGIYAVEDLETSYWPSFGGSTNFEAAPLTSMNRLKRLADGINFREFDAPGYTPTYTDLNVVSIHFYHNLCFICKGENSEPSMWVFQNVLPDAFR